MTGYRPREITPYLKKALARMPVVALTGMRQVGKSTLLQEEAFLKNRRYINLDDFASLKAAEEDPEGLLSGNDPITIDEVQKAPQLFPVIKRIVDKKKKPGQFLLSGSAQLLLLKNISESLAGRAVYLTLSPMSRREIHKATDREPFLVRFIKNGIWYQKTPIRPIKPVEIVLGGMPQVCFHKSQEKNIWFRGYEQTYLERDVRALSQISDLISFRNLIQLVAFRTGQILNQSELGRDAKLNSTTIGRYLSLFEMSFLTSRIMPYYSSQAKRLIKSPKIYLSDSGMASYFADIDISKKFSSPFSGALLETFVYQNLISILNAKLPDARLFFWNVQGRYEVDFVIEHSRKSFAIEIKQASRWNERDFTGLQAFLENTPNCQAAILAYNGNQVTRLGDRLWAIPLDHLLS